MKFVMLITVVGILTFISRINDMLWCFKPGNSINSGYTDICVCLVQFASMLSGLETRSLGRNKLGTT